MKSWLLQCAEVPFIATVFSDAPEGYNHWSLRLLAGRLVQLGMVETVSYETIHRRLKKRMVENH